jgi:hypothetical protein
VLLSRVHAKKQHFHPARQAFKNNIVGKVYGEEENPKKVRCSTPCSPPDLSKPLKKPKQFLFYFGFSAPAVPSACPVTYHNIF